MPLNWGLTRATPLDMDINTCPGALKVVNGDESMRSVGLMMITKEVNSEERMLVRAGRPS